MKQLKISVKSKIKEISDDFITAISHEIYFYLFKILPCTWRTKVKEKWCHLHVIVAIYDHIYMIAIFPNISILLFIYLFIFCSGLLKDKSVLAIISVIKNYT